MNLRREILQVVFGALIMGLFIQVGWLSPANDFMSNVLTSLVVMIVTRFVARIFGR